MTGNQKEFADFIKKTPRYILALKKQNRLVLTKDGKVDFEASVKKIKATGSPEKATEFCGRRNRTKVKREKKKTEEQQTEKDIESPMDIDSKLAYDYQKSRLEKVSYEVKVKRLEYEKSIGELLSRESVAIASFNLGKTINKRLMELPAKLAPIVTIECEQKENYVILNKSIEEILKEIEFEMKRLLTL
jgi:ABC-type Fe3+/spermidine/putrescine transport system ATPase subunit